MQVAFKDGQMVLLGHSKQNLENKKNDPTPDPATEDTTKDDEETNESYWEKEKEAIKEVEDEIERGYENRYRNTDWEQYNLVMGTSLYTVVLYLSAIIACNLIHTYIMMIPSEMWAQYSSILVG